jgi:hypothetical protein
MKDWQYKAKTSVHLNDPARNYRPKPGDFSLGSLQSRAAARALIQDKKKEDFIIQLIEIGPNGERILGKQIRIPAV